MAKCLYKVGEVFDRTMVDLWNAYQRSLKPDARPGSRNYRDPVQDTRIAGLADSIRSNGLLSPILVFWNGEDFDIAAGFRRVAAMKLAGIKKAQVMRVSENRPDLVRLAENLDRDNPTSYETCRYLGELMGGLHGPKRTAQEIADEMHVTPRHVQNLVRFYRMAPSIVRSYWQNDRDRKFTFKVLNELVALRDASEDQLQATLRRIVGPEEVEEPAVSVSSEDERNAAAQKSIASESNVAGVEEDGSGSSSGVARVEIQPPPSDEVAQDSVRYRRLGKVGAQKLGRRFEGVESQDRRLVIVRDFLRIIAGELPATRAEAIVEELLAEIAPALPASAKQERKRAGQRRSGSSSEQSDVTSQNAA